MGKSTISMAMFSSKPLNYQRVNPPSHPSQIVVLRIKKVVLSQKFLSGFHTTLPRRQSLTTTRPTRAPLEKRKKKKTPSSVFQSGLFGSFFGIIYDHLNPFRLLIYCCPGLKNHPENADASSPSSDALSQGCLDEDALPLFLINGVVHLRRTQKSFEQPKKDWWSIWVCLKMLG